MAKQNNIMCDKDNVFGVFMFAKMALFAYRDGATDEVVCEGK